MTSSLGYFRNRGSVADGQHLGKAELVPIRINDVKEALTPRRIRRRRGRQSLSLHPMARIYVIDPENSPPIPDWRPSDKDGTSFQAGECRTLAAIYTSSKRSLRHRCRNLVKKNATRRAVAC